MHVFVQCMDFWIVQCEWQRCALPDLSTVVSAYEHWTLYADVCVCVRARSSQLSLTSLHLGLHSVSFHHSQSPP